MADDKLAFPLDVPWKRLCVSEDMMDPEVCDRVFPNRWRSSLVVFEYEPSAEYQIYEGMVLSYLKVACTITGYQPNPDEVGIEDRRLDSGWNDPQIIEQFRDTVVPYYGCYGAVLEIAVAPKDQEGGSLDDYPYFVDFEPKKREIYETVSETGEKLSRSLEEVSVGKGATTTVSHEVLDIIGGDSWSAEAKGGEGGGSVAHEVSGQWGTKDMNQREYKDLRTTDRSQEISDTFSHTTQLTQIYSQLESYHLGTNRVFFFMLPRPHIVESEHTFVNGPRQLEGIQEFFLVVLRPESVKAICIEAYLETAHISSWPVVFHRQRAETYTFRIDTAVLGVPPDRSPENPETGNHTQWEWAENTETYPPGACPEGWEIDLDRDGGYRFGAPSSAQSADYYDYSVTSATRDGIEVHGRLRREYNTWGIDSRDWVNNYILEVPVTVYLRTKEPTTVAYDNTLFLTGRGLCCCPEEPGLRPVSESVVAEVDFHSQSNDQQLDGNAQISIREANRLRSEIGRQMLKYSNHPDRYPFGTMDLIDTQFLGRRLSALLPVYGHPDNQALQDIKGVDTKIIKMVSKIDPNVTRRWLLKTSVAEIKDRFGLTHKQAVGLRRAALGLAGPAPDPKDRWDPPGMKKRMASVPDIVGLSLESARTSLVAIPFLLGDVTYIDDSNPRGTVLEQDPPSGTKAKTHSQIHIKAASGLVAQIPDVVGKPLSEALIMLRDAGIKSEPTIHLSSKEIGCRDCVSGVNPPMRTWVTPHVHVQLQMSETPKKAH